MITVKIKLKGRFRKLKVTFSDCDNLIDVRQWLNSRERGFMTIGNHLIINISDIRYIKEISYKETRY